MKTKSKKKNTKHNEHRIFEESQKSYKKQQKQNDKIKMIFNKDLMLFLASSMIKKELKKETQ